VLPDKWQQRRVKVEAGQTAISVAAAFAIESCAPVYS
jgi:hypothetical protein